MSKFTHLFITISLLFLCSSTIHGEQKLSNNEKSITTILPRNTPTHRPKSPAKIYLVCQYSIGHISLSFPDDATYMDVSLNDETGPVWIGTISRTNPETEIPSLLGEYTIICQTDQNQIFEGTLFFIN